MAKTKISEYSSTAANNTDVANINIAEGCSPSNINNAIRAVMGHLKNFQDGSSGDSLTNSGTVTSSGTLAVTGGLTLDGSAGTTGQVLLSAGSGNTPTWGSGFPSGGIIMWSGTIATIPSGWYLCDGTNSTPDLRNKFIIAANADDAGVAKTTVTGTASQSGGTKDGTLGSHSHTFSGSVDDKYISLIDGNTSAGYTDPITINYAEGGAVSEDLTTGRDDGGNRGIRVTGDIDTNSISGTTNTQGSSLTNTNLPPYYALAFIMKG